MTTKQTTYHYFSSDGSYGYDIPLVLDTTNWTGADWALIEEASDDERAQVAFNIDKSKSA